MNWINYRSTKPLTYAREEIAAFPETCVLHLSAEETELFTQMALAIQANPYRIEEQEDFILGAKKIAAAFSPAARQFIDTHLQQGFGAVQVTGIPIDQDLPDTPATGGPLTPDYKQTFVSEAMLMALGALTGAEPFNFRQEGQGKAPLIDNIVPVYKLKTQKGAGGFDNNFPFHCESAWHRKRPDYLILQGIREAPDARTLVFSTQMFENSKWQDNSLEINNWFRLKAPDLYVQMEQAGIPMGTASYSFEPPLRRDEHGFRLNINFNGTDCVDMNAVNWLSELEDFVEANTVGAVIAPGNALLLNNYITCHTRTGYTPTFNGMDRWFLRGYFKKDLWAKSPSSAHNGTHDTNAFNELLDLGWISGDGNLTSSFSKYIYHPEETRQLTGRMAELAALAFHYTPIAGSRLV